MKATIKTVLTLAAIASLAPLVCEAALYQKINGAFVLMSPSAEATARADANSLFGNDSGFEVLLSSSEASTIRSGWAATDAQAAAKAAAAKAAAAILAGMLLSSASTPSLNGTYAIDATARTNYDGIYAGIKGGDGVPGGGATFTLRDMAGVSHSFDAASFVAFAKAARDYLYALSQGQTPALPVTIP